MFIGDLPPTSRAIFEHILDELGQPVEHTLYGWYSPIMSTYYGNIRGTREWVVSSSHIERGTTLGSVLASYENPLTVVEYQEDQLAQIPGSRRSSQSDKLDRAVVRPVHVEEARW